MEMELLMTVRELVHEVEMLERELREAAAIEIFVYSVGAAHGVLPDKVGAG